MMNDSGSINQSDTSYHVDIDKSQSVVLASSKTASSRGSSHRSSSNQNRTGSRGLDRAKEKELSAASQCSAEDLFAAMLGRKDLTKSVSEDGSMHYREEFCGACGVLHSRPELLHIYTR